MNEAMPPRVLLVEDDAGIERVVRKGLANHAIDVDWLREGRDVIAHLERQHYSAVVLDLMLPDADGFNLCRELRLRGVDTPICMLTARDELDDKLEGFDSGADDYLTKPFAIDELVARLRVLMRRGAAPTQRHAFGDVVIDARSREVRVGAQELLLTPREFDTLACLVAHAERPVSREHLIEAVWQSERSVTSNSVDVYVGYLRKKLAAARSTARIEAVRGIGFKLR
ncbi:MAG: response regulator transcription factor [Pseudomonadota bacterium]